MPDNPELLSERRAIVAGGQNIGTITVYASPAGLIEQLRQRLYTIGGMIFVLDVTLVTSLYLLLYQLILKPLTTIERYAANVKAGQNPGALPPRDWYFGELKTLERLDPRDGAADGQPLRRHARQRGAACRSPVERGGDRHLGLEHPQR